MRKDLGDGTMDVGASDPPVLPLKESFRGTQLTLVTTILAKSSDGISYYKVAFNNRDGVISIKCDCRAGELTKLCRHKLAIIRGDAAILYDNSQYSEFIKIKEWIEASPFAQLILEHDSIEKELQKKQREFRMIKEIIEVAMRKGV